MSGPWLSELSQYNHASGAGNLPTSSAGVPGGLSQLKDSISRFDIYAKGFVPSPTIFFDPSATSAGAVGTFEHPYTTEAQLYNAIRGNMAGQVLGFKRGSMIRTSATGLRLGQAGEGVYGTSAQPFYIVPYGDALELPIINASQIVTTWTSNGNGTWSFASALNQDVYYAGIRLTKVAAAVNVTGPGLCSWATNTLTIWPTDSASPNGGQTEVTLGNYVLTVSYPKSVAGVGYISVAGLDCQKSRFHGIYIQPTGVGTPGNILGVNVYGTRCGHLGVDDAGSNFPADGLAIGGIDDSNRIAGEAVGNELYDCLNNSIELNSSNGYRVALNYGHDVGGNSVVELFSANANAIIENNIGKRASHVGRLGTAWRQSGIWANNFNTASVVDATRLINVNAKIRFNYIEDCASWGMDLLDQSAVAGSSIVHHNTIIQRTYDINQAGAFNFAGAQPNTSTGWNVSNNAVLDFGSGAGGNYYLANFNSANGIPQGTNNVYWTAHLSSNQAIWNVNGTGGGQITAVTGIAAYKALLAISSGTYGGPFDQNSSQPAGTPNAKFDTTGHPVLANPIIHSVVQIAGVVYSTYADGQASDTTVFATPGCYDLPTT